MSREGSAHERPYLRVLSLPGELAVVAAVILVWQAARIPVEGSIGVSVAHAHDWLRLEGALHLRLEGGVVRAVHAAGLAGAAEILYANLHLVVMGAFLGGVRLLSPLAYPRLRTTFVLAHLPAIAILAAYPLAPPRWLTELPHSEGPPPDGLTAGAGGLLKNSTAAAVSLHFGYALLAGVTALWLLRRFRIAPLVLLWPAFVFLLIVGTGNHYVLDTIVGSLCIGAAALAAHMLHRGTQTVEVPRETRRAAVGGIVACVLVAYAATAMLAGRWPNRDPVPLVALPVAATIFARNRSPARAAERAQRLQSSP